LLAISLPLFAQKNFSKEWYMGSPNYKITFNGDTAYSQLLKPTDIKFPRTLKSNANICDSSGNFLFSSNALQLYNKYGELIDSSKYNIGDTMVLTFGLYPAANQSIILPKGPNQFYVFTCTQSDQKAYDYYVGVEDTFDFDQILYSVVDMSANNGKGAIIENQKLLLQARSPWISKSNFTCTRHANGRDWWLIKPSARDRNIKYKYLVTPDTILASQEIEYKNFGRLNNDNVGQSCFSADGTWYVECNKESPHTIYRFDRCEGKFTLVRQIEMSKYNKINTTRYDGVCFSPNNKYLYTSDGWYIYQIDLAEPNDSMAIKCVSEQDTILFPMFYNTMQITPTGQLHMGSWAGISPFQNAIMRPNEYGLASGYKTDYIVSSLPYVSWKNAPFNDPPNMPFFELGALKGSPCDTLNKIEIVNPHKNWNVYPNPTTDKLTIEVPTKDAYINVSMFNLLGQKVLQNKLLIDDKFNTYLDVVTLPSGIYVLYIETQDKPVVHKIIKQ
jgi:hypothetical protein